MPYVFLNFLYLACRAGPLVTHDPLVSLFRMLPDFSPILTVWCPELNRVIQGPGVWTQLMFVF